MKKMLYLIPIVLIAISVSFFYVDRSDQTDSNNTVLQLLAPPFVNQVLAADTNLADEAGISAWYQGTALNLNNAKTACKDLTIPEIETNDYFICQLTIPNYHEKYNPHVYVHKDGWIMAFYFRDDPAGKMLNVYARTLNSTILKTAVATVATAAGIGFTDVNYYDFRYPNATNMLLVAEDGADGNTSFTIEMPTTYIYHERSWAFYKDYYAEFWLNGVNFYGSNIFRDGNTAYGILTATQLQPGVTNEFRIHSHSTQYGAILITYQVP